MKLFDLIKIFFGNNPEYLKLKSHDKGKHRFLINRFFAIRYPLVAHKLNLNGTDPVHVVDCWHLVATQSNRTPGWMYTKVRKEKEKDTKKFTPMPETILYYLRKNKLAMSDYKDCLKFNEAELLDELKKIEEAISGKAN